MFHSQDNQFFVFLTTQHLQKRRTGVRFQVLFNLATWSNYSITNYFKIPVLHFFENVINQQLKLVNVDY